MKNPNVRILLIVLVLVAAVAVAGVLTSRRQDATDITQAYLRLQVNDEVWPLIPLTDGEQVVEQPDGTKNIIRTTPTGAVMAFSTCHNQNCVQQGEVTLENRDSRALGSLIVCLPNKVIVEVLTPQEAGVE